MKSIVVLFAILCFCVSFSYGTASYGLNVKSEKFLNGKWFKSYNYDIKGSDSEPAPNVTTFWFTQNLDHFNPTDTRIWKQRYFINDTFYKPGGPIFLMIGGEGEENPLWMSHGSWIKYAEHLGAFCFSLEHRYYGKSRPTPDLSLPNLIYLTSEQALADLAHFTVSMREKYNFTDNKVVAFGGSYPGSLAAWFRMKYPHIVDIAVSSSAPLKAELNFKEYLGVVTHSIYRTNPTCLNKIAEAVRSMEMLLKRRTGWWMIQKELKICGNFRGDNSKDIANLFETLAGNFEGIVQYNKDNRGFEGSSTANITIETLCDIMTDESQDLTSFQRYARVNDLLLQASNQNCTDSCYCTFIKNMKQVDWNSDVASGARQWTYQTCNEFGFFQSSDLGGDKQPFGTEFGIDFSVRQCQDIYDMKYDQNYIENAIRWTNTNYGSKVIGFKVSKVIFVNGSIDPWSWLGITKQNQTTDENLVIFIDGTAHCANMYPDSPNDLPQLVEARIKTLNQIEKWLKE